MPRFNIFKKKNKKTKLPTGRQSTTQRPFPYSDVWESTNEPSDNGFSIQKSLLCGNVRYSDQIKEKTPLCRILDRNNFERRIEHGYYTYLYSSPDGACLFHSLLSGLRYTHFPDSISHISSSDIELRKEVVNHITTFWDYYKNFIVGDPFYNINDKDSNINAIKKYKIQMLSQFSYGGSVEIIAFTRIFNTCAVVLCWDRFHVQVKHVYTPDESLNHNNSIFLWTHTGPGSGEGTGQHFGSVLLYEDYLRREGINPNTIENIYNDVCIEPIQQLQQRTRTSPPKPPVSRHQVPPKPPVSRHQVPP